MGIRPSITAVYKKDPKTGVSTLVGYSGSGQTYSQKKAGKQPQKGFGIDTPEQEKAVKAKESKRKDTQEKILKRRGTKKPGA